MKLTYPGPFDAVDVPALGKTVERGETIEVPEGHAESLIDQGWQPTAKASKAATATPDEEND